MLASSINVAGSHWQPPVGIPMPPFGIHEQAPALPSPWTSERPGFYYVNDDIGTDTGRTYGSPVAPRRSIPTTLPAGSVVILAGTYDLSHADAHINSQGTAAQPVFIRGTNNEMRPTFTRKWTIRGSYVILEYLDAFWSGSAGGALQLGGTTFQATNAVVRNSELRGDGSSTAVDGINIAWADHILIWNNKIHDIGYDATEDVDREGVSSGATASNIWVLENEIYRTVGSGMQFNAGNAADRGSTHHIYVGRNHIYDTRQSGLAVKYASDLVFSENEVHDVRTRLKADGSVGSPSKCIGFQYGPERLWIINNHLYRCWHGVFAGSFDSGIGLNTFVIGNLIHDISAPIEYVNFNTPWHHGSAIGFAGGNDVTVAQNTIWNSMAGINVAGDAKLTVVNNIIGQPSHAQGHHMFMEFGTAFNVANVKNNLFAGTFKVKYGTGAPFASLSTFESAEPSLRAGNINSDPLLISAGNYRLSEGSPAQDAGLAGISALTDAFESTYEEPIALDIDRIPRPQGSGWDIGAYEFIPEGMDVWPPYISGGSPTSVIAPTTNATLSVETSEDSTCKYSAAAGMQYGSMSSFQITGQLIHSTPITGLTPGNSYNFSIKCSDGTNINTDDYVISFTIFPLPDCTLTAPTTVSPNAGFNITWNATGAIHATLRVTGNPLSELNGTAWPSEVDLYYLLSLTLPAKINASTGSTTLSLCFDQGAINGTYSQCLARNPNKVCTRTITIAGTQMPSIEGDINNDSSINLLDIQSIVSHWGKTSAYPSNIDLSSPGVIDLFDVMVVVRNWGRTQ